MVDVSILGSGSGGNAMVLRHGQDALLVDAGFTAKELERRLDEAGIAPTSLTGILVSHEHDDHVRGLRVFAKRHGTPAIYANALTAERLRYLDKAPERMQIFSNGAPFAIGAFEVDAFSVCHDAVDPVGFVVRCGEWRLGIATDLGHVGMAVPFKLKNCQTIVLESNHDPELLRCSRRPVSLQNRIRSRRGHLSNEMAAQLVQKVVGPATTHLVMAHLSGECNRPEIVEQTVRGRLRLLQRDDIHLHIAEQDRVAPALTAST